MSEKRSNILETVFEHEDIDTILFDIKDENNKLYYNSKNFIKNVNKSIVNHEFLIKCKLKNKRFIAGINCYFDNSIKDKPEIITSCLENGKKILYEKKNRVCPTNLDYKQYLLSIIDELAELKIPIHLAYFRYIDLSHCYCDRCITNFAKSINYEHLNPNEIFQNTNLFVQWINWRANQLNMFLQDANKRIKKINQKISLSVEMDIDSHKGYLLGVKIDEGQDLFEFLKHTDEFVLHIESYGWETLNDLNYEKKVNRIKYIIGLLRQHNKKIYLMYWRIKKVHRFKKALDIHLRTNPDGSLFYYEKNLLKWISDYTKKS